MLFVLCCVVVSSFKVTNYFPQFHLIFFLSLPTLVTSNLCHPMCWETLPTNFLFQITHTSPPIDRTWEHVFGILIKSVLEHVGQCLKIKFSVLYSVVMLKSISDCCELRMLNTQKNKSWGKTAEGATVWVGHFLLSFLWIDTQGWYVPAKAYKRLCSSSCPSFFLDK